MDRRNFLKFLGIGSAVAAVAPSVLADIAEVTPNVAEPIQGQIAVSSASNQMFMRGKGSWDAIEMQKQMNQLHSELLMHCRKHADIKFSYIP